MKVAAFRPGGSLCRLVSVCTLIALATVFVLPAPALAQLVTSPDEEQPAKPPPADTYAMDPCTSGTLDAKQYNSTTGYLMLGFLCGIFGFLIALASSPEPPADRIIGKEPDWVRVYSDCYTKQAKKANRSSACSGWAVGAAVSVLYFSLSGSY